MRDESKTKAQLINGLVYAVLRGVRYSTEPVKSNHFLVRLILAAMTVSMMLVAAPILAEGVQQPESPRIIVGGDYDYPPYGFLDENGEPAGYNVELTRAIAEVMGLDVEIRLGPWGEIREALEAGEIDAIHGMFYSEERDQVVDFSPPHTIVHHAIFARRGSPAVESVEELRGKDIIVMRGDIMHDYVLEHSLSDDPVLVETQADALRLLASGEHDCALVAKLPGLYWVRELQLSNIVTVGPPIRPSEYCYAVREGDAALLARFSEGLAILKETGRYHEIYDEWLGVLEPQGVSAGVILKYAAFVLLPLLVLLMGTGLWSWSLRRRVTRRTEELEREITERKRAEEALQRSQYLLQATGRMTQVGGWEIDLETQELTWTEEVYRIHQVDLNYKPTVTEAINFYAPESRPLIEQAVQRAIEDGEPFDLELQLVTAKGDLIWVHAIGEAHQRGGNAIKVSGTFQDINMRKQAEEEREILIRELEAKNAELERFTYTVSHDLKSPLITIKGFLGLLERDAAAGDTERLSADVTRISNAADRMQTLLEELLELSRIGRLVNPPEEVLLGELVHEAVYLVSGRLAEQDVQVEIADDLPVVYADRPRIREVLENLVDNAVKFMGDQPHPRVEIGVRADKQHPRDKDETVVYVQDNGMGIDPRYHERVFDLFDKLDPKTEGTGVGLAIVKRIVEVHGGRVWVESEGAGQGSTFCFTLPGSET